MSKWKVFDEDGNEIVVPLARAKRKPAKEKIFQIPTNLYGGWVFGGWVGDGRWVRYCYFSEKHPTCVLTVSDKGNMEILAIDQTGKYRTSYLTGRVEYLLLPEDR